MPTTVKELQEKGVLEDVVNSKMVQKYLAYRDLADGIEALKEDDVMYNQLIQGIKNRYSKLNEKTIRRVIEEFVNEVESNTAVLKSAEDDEEYTGKKTYD
jgi:hypothetical protein